MGVGGSLGADMAVRFLSRSSGGRFKGCVSKLRTVLEADLEDSFLCGDRRDSDSFRDLVGDFERDLLEGEFGR